MSKESDIISPLDAWSDFKNGYKPNTPPCSYHFSVHENIEVYYRYDLSKLNIENGRHFIKLKAIVKSSYHEHKANYHLSVKMNSELTIQNDKESRNLKLNFPEDFAELQDNMLIYLQRLDAVIKSGGKPSPGESNSRLVRAAKIKAKKDNRKCKVDVKKKAVGDAASNLFNPDDKD